MSTFSIDIRQFEMAFAVCEFHIISHLLFWVSGGGDTNSPYHVLYLGISRAHVMLNPYPINRYPAGIKLPMFTYSITKSCCR